MGDHLEIYGSEKYCQMAYDGLILYSTLDSGYNTLSMSKNETELLKSYCESEHICFDNTISIAAKKLLLHILETKSDINMKLGEHVLEVISSSENENIIDLCIDDDAEKLLLLIFNKKFDIEMKHDISSLRTIILDASNIACA